MNMIKNSNIEDFFPLSPMQQGMLFHTLYAPESGVYLDQLSCLLRGGLNISALERAWQRVVNRHQILRTAFVWEGLKEPVQVVHRNVELPLELYDWRAVPHSRRQEKLKMLLQSHRSIGLELTRPPLMRVAVARTGEQEYQLAWSRTHLLLDGWSVPILLKEVFAFYEAFARGEDLDISPSRPFRNYVVWLKRQDMSKAEAFWRQALKGFSAPTSLGISRARTGAFDREQGHHSEELRLSAETTASLIALGKDNQITLSTLVQGAWAVLLSRYSGEEDVVFGSTVAGRPPSLPGVESMLGLFINTLAVRAQVSAEAFTLPWLKKFQELQLDLRQYEYSPLMQVQGWSDVPRGAPLFETLVVFENLPVYEGIPEQQLSIEIGDARVLEQTNYPLYMVVMPYERLLLRINYDGKLYERDAVRRMLGHLERILEGIVADPGGQIKDLPMLTEIERRQLLEEWNGTGRQYSSNRCIHQLFEAQAERAPDATALVYERERLSYRDLNARANQLAHYLIAMGIEPDDLIGICVDRSMDMVAGILGILKAGGAYLPLDPEYPSERLAFMMEDARPRVVLTRRKFAESLSGFQADVVCLDEEWDSISRQSANNPVGRVAPGNLAYVIYTSGSTGKPKGVMVSHDNVVRLFEATRSIYDFDESDVWTLFHSFAFDFSVWELWGALFYGGRLIVVPYWISRSPEAFYEMLINEQVTVLNQTPSAFRQLMQADEKFQGMGRLNLRLVIFGGESLEAQGLKGWMQGHGDERPKIFNMYGITETTVHVTVRRITQEDVSGNAGSAIGGALEDLQVYILDKFMEPVPIGVAGEMYVGGAGVARGYLARPDLTAERFMADPFGRQPGALLYRTGDVGCYLARGEIEYLGRADQQVKIRGFRIEPGEIEEALAHHPAINEAVVVAREDEPGDKRLVAYIVAVGGQTPTAGELRAFSKRKLPEYMVPSAFVILDALPLTQNGKVNKRALPVPGQERPDLESFFVAPRTSVETTLARIWAEVLGIEQVGVDDNFFDLGGHSLLVMQVAARVREAFQIDLSLARLFEAPILADLAGEIAGMQSDHNVVHTPAAQTIRRRTRSVDQQLAELSRLSEDEAQTLMESEAGLMRDERP